MSIIKTVLLVITVLLQCGLTFFIVKFYYHESIFSATALALLTAIIAIAILIITITDYLNYCKYNEKKLLLPAGITWGMVVFCAALFYGFELKKTSPIVFRFTDPFSSVNELEINFRKNGTYEFTSEALGRLYRRGNYTTHGDKIELEKNWLDTLIISPHFMNKNGEILHVNSDGVLIP